MKNKHCLLIEDESDDALIVKKHVDRQPGFTVEWVKDGQQAVQYLENKPPYSGRNAPDIILLDMRLPVMDGFAFLEWRQTTKELRRVPVLVMSCLSSPDDMRRAHDLGVNAYLTKPLNWGQFEQQLSKLASGPAPVRPQPRSTTTGGPLKHLTCTLTFRDGKKVVVTAAARSDDEPVRFDYAGDPSRLRPYAERGTLGFLRWYMRGMAANLDAELKVEEHG